MATLRFRKLDDAVYARLGVRARRNNRSFEAEARAVLDERTRDLDQIVADLRACHAAQIARHGVLPDCRPLIRLDRGE